MYRIVNDPNTGAPSVILRLADSACIPIDPENRDYAEYLAWVAAGNTPLPAPSS